ncbi:hypothetical protein SAMN05444416_1199 [Thermoactinomyces sp. DSM 45892]|nr:hypothetical protein SAMN05444416_1199 [Thermoactinomyces sp. DSM 45892]
MKNRRVGGYYELDAYPSILRQKKPIFQSVLE